MKQELERWSDGLSATEDAGLWRTLQGALREETRRRPASRQRPEPGCRPERLLAAGVTVAALAVFMGWVALSPQEPAAPLPGRLNVRLLEADSVWAACRAASGTEPAAVAATGTEPAAATETFGTEPAAATETFGTGPAAIVAAADAPAKAALSGTTACLPAGPGEIRGVVRDRATGAPLTPANILVEGTPWGTMSLEDGSFLLRDIPAGTYGIRVQMMGYEDMLLPDVEIRPGDLAELGLDLESKIPTCLGVVSSKGARISMQADNTGASHSVEATDLSALVVDAPEAATGLMAGVIAKGGELHIRGGSAGDVSYPGAGSPVPNPPTGHGAVRIARNTQGCRGTRGRSQASPPPQSISPASARFPSGTGGRVPVNGQLADDMFFEHAGTNPFIDADEDSLSTFGLDVDTGSYTVTRRYLTEGHLPPPAAVRVEEFVNFFRKDYPAPAEGDFRIQIDGMPAPFAHAGAEGYRLVRIGIRGRVIDSRERTPAQIVLVVDTSGSMELETRLELVKRALETLLAELRPDDELGIVAYGSWAREVLPMTPLTEVEAIRHAVRALHPQGSTNAEAGLRMGYDLLRRAARPGRIHRVILCSDGVANEGQTMPESILEAIRADAETITLTALGFGMGNYNDVLLEKLADAGDGQYAYIDNFGEAVRILRENLTGTLQVIARNAKAQVAFDPGRVERYRLLGYENRDVRDADFRNNKVDAGEIGAGHEVTALYEIRLRAGAQPGRLAAVRLRYERPERGDFIELEQVIGLEQLAAGVDEASPSLVLDAGVAEFAEILRRSYWAQESSPAAVLDLLRRLPGDVRGRPDVAEFITLVERASALAP